MRFIELTKMPLVGSHHLKCQIHDEDGIFAPGHPYARYIDPNFRHESESMLG